MAPPTSSPGVPSLPPSVEEAYRRKCVQLRKRTAEVDEANDAARVRLARLKRQVEKQRLERAFLLEQLAKRTSINVEDSDGSPSPPPTPKDKPLRTKRGHRKASNAGPGGEPMSPGSDVPRDSQTQNTQVSTGSARGTGRGSRKVAKDKDEAGGAKTGRGGSRAKGASAAAAAEDKDAGDDGAVDDAKAKSGGAGSSAAEGSSSAKPPTSGWALYCQEMRPTLVKKKEGEAAKRKSADEDGDVEMEDAAATEDSDAAATSVEAELARGWKELTASKKDEMEARATEERAKHDKAKEDEKSPKAKEGSDDDEAKKDEDVDAKKADDAAGDGEDKDKNKADEAETEAAKTAEVPTEDKEDTEMADPDATAAATTPSGDKDE